MVDRNLKQWRTVVEYVERRRQADYDERLIGEVGDRFEYNRGQLLQSVGKNARTSCSATTASASPSSSRLHPGRGRPDGRGRGRGRRHRRRGRRPRHDALPRRDRPDRRRHNRGLRPLHPPQPPPQGTRGVPREDRRPARAPRRGRRRQFETELDRSIERMRDAIAPYTRFVRTEHARMSRAREDLAAIDAETDALKQRSPPLASGQEPLPEQRAAFRCRLGRLRL